MRDGRFEFTVTRMNCDSTQIGSPQFGRTAQGVFCIVSVKVTNIGDRAQSFNGSNQYAFDAQNRNFSTDATSAIYLEESKSFLNQLNPGSTVQGKIVYDVPKDTKLARLELHDSAFSSGAKVNLS